MTENTALRGRARIAHEIGVSERTASRWRKRGLLDVKQLGGPTSAWRVDGDAVDLLTPHKPKDKRR